MLTAYIEKLYELVGRDKPVIIVANNPLDYKEKFIQLQNETVLEEVNKIYEKKNGKLAANTVINLDFENVKLNRDIEIKSHYLYLCSTYHRVYLMWYKFIQDEFNIDHKNKDILNWLYKNANNNISRCYFTPMYVLVLRMPKRIRRNNIGFHSVDAPAIEWDGYKLYYINGRKLEEDIFTRVIDGTYSFKEFVELNNEDTKASIVSLITEKFGNEKLMEFLNAEIVDEKTITHDSGHTEVVRIWKTKEKYEFLSDINGNSNQPYSWLELKCPTSGSIYLIPTSAHFTDAVEACKFHRPQSIPMELSYNFMQFNN